MLSFRKITKNKHFEKNIRIDKIHHNFTISKCLFYVIFWNKRINNFRNMSHNRWFNWKKIGGGCSVQKHLCFFRKCVKICGSLVNFCNIPIYNNPVLFIRYNKIWVWHKTITFLSFALNSTKTRWEVSIFRA